jgi:hypothetical protein
MATNPFINMLATIAEVSAQAEEISTSYQYTSYEEKLEDAEFELIHLICKRDKLVQISGSKKELESIDAYIAEEFEDANKLIIKIKETLDIEESKEIKERIGLIEELRSEFLENKETQRQITQNAESQYAPAAMMDLVRANALMKLPVVPQMPLAKNSWIVCS